MGEKIGEFLREDGPKTSRVCYIFASYGGNGQSVNSTRPKLKIRGRKGIELVYLIIKNIQDTGQKFDSLRLTVLATYYDWNMYLIDRFR